MSFPIQIIRVEDMMFLISSTELTEEFRTQLTDIERQGGTPGGYLILSYDYPAFGGNCIYISGNYESERYKTNSTKFNERIFNDYQKTIEYYKKRLGYNE